jgi:hypothetical protein
VAVRRADLTLVEPVWIDQRKSDRKVGCALVMVADDNVEAGVGGFLERLERLGAAIDRNREACSAPFQFDQRRARWAIALHQPVGDVDHRLDAQPAKQKCQQRRRGRTVDVIVAEDGDRLSAFDRVGNPRCRLIHVLERRWVGQEIPDRGSAMARKVGFVDTAGEEKLVDEVAAQIVAPVAAPAPRLADQAALDAAGEATHLSSSARSASASGRISAGTW